MAEIRCSNCGWRNEPGARMCGGCGRPLRASLSPGATPLRSQYANYANVADDDTPTVVDLPPMAQPRTPSRPPDVDWAAARQRQPRRGVTAGKALLVVLTVLALALLGAAGAWATVIRPQVHQRVDSELRAPLGTMVAMANQQPYILSVTLSIPAADMTQALQQQIPSDLPVQNVRVNFSGGRVIVSFTTDGFDGAVSTALVARNGRLTAAATEVDGPLALVESGSEMEALLNGSLAKLRAGISVRQVTLDKDMMTVSLRATSPSPASSSAAGPVTSLDQP